MGIAHAAGVADHVQHHAAGLVHGRDGVGHQFREIEPIWRLAGRRRQGPPEDLRRRGLPTRGASGEVFSVAGSSTARVVLAAIPAIVAVAAVRPAAL